MPTRNKQLVFRGSTAWIKRLIICRHTTTAVVINDMCSFMMEGDYRSRAWQAFILAMTIRNVSGFSKVIMRVTSQVKETLGQIVLQRL